jgi:hypothetical protein
MSDAILSGDVTVHYLSENRQARLAWTGSPTGTRTVGELYSALMELLDGPGNMDEPMPMSAQTPYDYTVGTIYSGNLDPWYVSYEMTQHLKRAGIHTAGWERGQGAVPSNGIVVVPVMAESNTLGKDDEGKTVVGEETGRGTLLEILRLGENEDYLMNEDYLIVRPASGKASDDFANSQYVRLDGTTRAVQSRRSNTGEQVWANVYSIGIIQPNDHVGIKHGPPGCQPVVSLAGGGADWWGNGHVDVLIHTKDFRIQSFPVLKDIVAFVRGKAYSTVAQGRVPVPIYAPEPYEGENYVVVADRWDMI